MEEKKRRRSLISSILICVFTELGIPFKLFLSISRCRGCFIETEGISLDKILSLIFDIEETMKIPSTPLDLLTVYGYIDKDDSVIIISDGFSEQLTSSHSSVTDVFELWKEYLFLLCIKGRDKEALPADKQSELENSLKKNFKKNMMIIEKTSDLRSSLELLQKAFFTDNIQDNYKVNSVSEQEECDVSLTEDLTTVFPENLSFVEIASISSGHNPEYLTILDDELNQTPQMAVDNSVMRQFSTYIKPDNLFDALSINVFIPNKI